VEFAVHLLRMKTSTEAGLDLRRVQESKGILFTNVAGCEIRAVNGRLEEYMANASVAVALPCNEHFDDRCTADTKSALGAYVSRIFDGRSAEFVFLLQQECVRHLGSPHEQQKTEKERGWSYGVGRRLFMAKPLGRFVPLAVVSTTTQRAGEGLSGRISYLFSGMRELVGAVADARIS